MNIAEKTIDGHLMRFYKNGDGIHKYLKRWEPGKQDREPCFMRVIDEEVEPGMVVAEVGANVGYQTLRIARNMANRGHIYAAEPDIRNYELLEWTIQQNGLGDMVTLSDVAVCDHVGNTEFHVAKKATNLNSIRRTKNAKKPKTVACTTLSAFTPEDAPANFVKMDIEGAEVDVLRGFYDRASTEKFPCKILFETHPKAYTEGFSLADELERYFKLGFYPKYLISATTKRPAIFAKYGYEPHSMSPKKIRRAIYAGVAPEHAIEMAAFENPERCPIKKKWGKSVRFLMIARD